MNTPEDNRFAPPKTPVADLPSAARGQMPRAVALAVRLLWISLLLGIPATVIYFARTPLDAGVLIGLVFFQAAVFAFVAWVITRIAMGRNWARIAMLLFSVLGLLLFPLPEDTTVMEYLLGGIGSLLDAIAMILLFFSQGRSWFKPDAARRE